MYWQRQLCFSIRCIYDNLLIITPTHSPYGITVRNSFTIFIIQEFYWQVGISIMTWSKVSDHSTWDAQCTGHWWTEESIMTSHQQTKSHVWFSIWTGGCNWGETDTEEISTVDTECHLVGVLLKRLDIYVRGLNLELINHFTTNLSLNPQPAIPRVPSTPHHTLTCACNSSKDPTLAVADGATFCPLMQNLITADPLCWMNPIWNVWPLSHQHTIVIITVDLMRDREQGDFDCRVCLEILNQYVQC